MTLNKKYWISVICKIISIMEAMIISIFINRGLGVYNKGEYIYIINIVELFYVLFSFGMGQSYSTFKRVMNNSVCDLFISITLINSLLSLFFCLFIFVNKEFYIFINIIFLTPLAVLKVVFSMIAVIEQSIKRNVIITIVSFLYLLVVLILYYLNELTLKSALFLYGLNDIITIIIIGFNYKLKPEIKHFDKNLIKEIYKVGFVTMLLMILISINYRIDTIMLKNISNSYYLGLYSVGVNFSNMFLLIPDAFKEVIFSDSTKKDFSKKVAFNSIKVSLVFCTFICIFFIIFGKIFIKILYGVEYEPSYYLTLIIFIGSLFMVFFKILQPIYISHGRQKKAITILIFSAIINIVINYILIPQYNSIGAAIATAISYSICGLLFFIDYITDKDFYKY